MNSVQMVNALLEQMEGPWGRSNGTCYKYRNGYRVFLEWADKPIAAMGTHDLELFLARRPAAPSTTAWELAILQTLYRFLHEHLGVVGSNPAKVLVKPRVHNEAPKPVGDDLWRRVWAAPLLDDERVALGLGYFVGLLVQLGRTTVCNCRAAKGFSAVKRGTPAHEETTHIARRPGLGSLAELGVCTDGGERLDNVGLRHRHQRFGGFGGQLPARHRITAADGHDGLS